MTDKLALPTGVEFNGKQLRIWFMFNGQRFREALPGVAKVNKATINYADNKRRTILAEIKEGRFDYAAHFPDSPRAAIFSGNAGAGIKRTVQEGVERWMEVQQAKKASSTSRNYGSKSNHVKAWAGQRRIVDISKSDLELFQASLLRSGLAPKTVNDIFTVVRGVWADAYGDGILKSNPLDRIKNIERDHDDDSADPFTRDELALVAAVKTTRQQDVNMILFDCWAGLSISELIGLGWDDVDLEAGTAVVRRARVESEYKVPKEKSRVRLVELIDPALEYLKQQFAETGELPAVTISVTQRDNVTKKRENVRFVFRNDSSGEPWHASSVNRWFTGHLKRAGVRHRGPNQCRHTFASQAVSSYVPLEWVARQLGHTDTTMVKRHYGRWIPNDTKSMAALVSQMMGFRDADTAGNLRANLGQS
ncbi:Arm DNA-binding domain-containing protein [Pseudomonas syringae]|nr:tyrosine-type recombinase/integrase [Pseudomonas syringae]